jgi:hypothetical protein
VPATDARADMTAIRPGSVSTEIRVVPIQAGVEADVIDEQCPSGGDDRIGVVPLLAAAQRQRDVRGQQADDDAGVAGRGRDQDLLGGRLQDVRQSASHRVEFALVPELGQLPGQARGVGGARCADLSHLCKTFSFVFSAVATCLGRLDYVMGKSK